MGKWRRGTSRMPSGNPLGYLTREEVGHLISTVSRKHGRSPALRVIISRAWVKRPIPTVLLRGTFGTDRGPVWIHGAIAALPRWPSRSGGSLSFAGGLGHQPVRASRAMVSG